MHLTVSGKQLDVGEALRKHVEQTLTDIVGKYFSHAVDAHVTFSRQAHLYRADIKVHAARGLVLQSTADATDPYPAFDQATERMGQRLRRYKDRLVKTHSHRPETNEGVPEDLAAGSAYYVIDSEKADTAADIDAKGHPAIVAETTLMVENLTVSEAVMRLDLGQLPAVLFKNRAHGGLNMVYRRADGNIGWVDPQNLPGSLPGNLVGSRPAGRAA